jgi:hypothetical protein
LIVDYLRRRSTSLLTLHFLASITHTHSLLQNIINPTNDDSHPPEPSYGAVDTDRDDTLQAPILLDETSPPPSWLQESDRTRIQNFLYGVVETDRDDLLQAIILNEKSPPPSWLQRLLCDCGSGERTASGIEDIPEISNLAGLLLQNGDETHSTNGTVFTFKWGKFNKETRVGELEVYGGCGGQQHTGSWTMLNNQTWKNLSLLGRCCNYTYQFTFSEDWQNADIDIKANCCLIPCVRPWYTIPKSYCAFKMYQAEDSENGSHWIRTDSKKGGPFEVAYSLEAVYTPDGKPTAFVHNLETSAPKTMLLSR